MKNKKVGIFRWIWYAVLGFLIVGYIDFIYKLCVSIR